MGKTKLELTWVGKDERPRLEPRVLIEESALSHRIVPWTYVLINARAQMRVAHSPIS